MYCSVIWVYSGVFTFLVEAVSTPMCRHRTSLLGATADLAEQYPLYAASALAANSFARSYFAAVGYLPGSMRKVQCV